MFENTNLLPSEDKQYLSQATLDRLKQLRGEPPIAVPPHRKVWRRMFGPYGVVSGAFSRAGNNVCRLLTDIEYSIKVLDCVLSGHRGLAYRVGEAWVAISDDDLSEIPYYVCAEFQNGRHIPLPLILLYGGDYPIQDWLLGVLVRRCSRRGLLRGMYNALEDCALYQHSWDQWSQEEPA